MQLSRFYVITGKGGVGKSLVATALTRAIQNRTEKKVLLVQFDHSGPGDLEQDESVERFTLDLWESIELYVSHKLKSKVIGKWVASTHFFRALINMIPGFAYLVHLGHILYKLKHEPDLIVVLDSPSSGHAQTLFESAFHFKDIFKTGMLVNDIDEMLSMLQDPSFLKIIIAALPTEMAIEESFELKKNLLDCELPNVDIVLNSCMSEQVENAETLPNMLKTRVATETKILEENSNKVVGKLPFCPRLNEREKVDELIEHCEVLL